MAAKAHKYRVEHNSFPSMQEAFEDCVRYSKAVVIFIDSDSATIEISPEGNPSMQK